MYKMYGTIIGDMAGSTYEFKNIKYILKRKDLINKKSEFTDDTVMALAVAKGIYHVLNNENTDYKKSDLSLDLIGNKDKQDELYLSIQEEMQIFGRCYPNAGYGGHFREWINSSNPKPYNSWGNGSAMRVAYCGWIANSLEEAELLAEISAKITHDHFEGIKGAKVVAGCIFLLRKGATKEEIREYALKYYYLDFTLDEIRPTYKFDVSCQGSVPQAIEAFLEGEDFCDVISKSISIGGDSDTIAAIAGSIAEAFYEIPDFLYNRAIDKMDDYLLDTLEEVNGLLE